MGRLTYKIISIMLIAVLLAGGALAFAGAYADEVPPGSEEGEPQDPGTGGGEPQDPGTGGGGTQDPGTGGGGTQAPGSGDNQAPPPAAGDNNQTPPAAGDSNQAPPAAGDSNPAQPALMSAPAVGGAIPCGVAQTTSGNAQLNQPVEPPPSPFPAPGEVMKIVDVWTRPGSKGKILFRLYPGDEVTVLEMSGVHALITCKEGEGYANMNRLSFQFAGDIPAKAITRGSLYTMPKKGETGDKIKDSGFKQNDEFFATSRIGKWIHVYQTGGLDGWILATKLKLMI